LRSLLQEQQESESELKQENNLEKIHEEDISFPSRSEILRQENQDRRDDANRKELQSGKHIPVIEKPSKTFSIKDIISDDIKTDKKPDGSSELPDPEPDTASKVTFSAEAFENSWPDFINQLNGEGPRIISMFKSIKTEVENDQTIRIHLSNAAQRDTFVQHYRQRLLAYIQNKFFITEVDIETAVDLAETNEILYSDEQKYNYLLNKYPILKELKKNFNLDIT